MSTNNQVANGISVSENQTKMGGGPISTPNPGSTATSMVQYVKELQNKGTTN